jgi:hypothetical protein
MLPRALPKINPTASPPSTPLYARKDDKETIMTIRVKNLPKSSKQFLYLLLSVSDFLLSPQAEFPVISQLVLGNA